MAIVLRTILAVVCSLLFAFVMVVGVEFVGAMIHPIPEGFKGTNEEMCQHVANIPAWFLALVNVLWPGIAFASTWIAAKIGSAIHGFCIGILLLCALGFNMALLPYPLWFIVLNLVLFPLAIFLGIWTANKKIKLGDSIQGMSSNQ